MRKRRFITHILGLLIILTTAACSTAEKVVDSGVDALKRVRPSSPGLKKRVLVVPVINDTGSGPEFAARINQELIENLRGSEVAVFYETTEPLPQPTTDPDAQYGVVHHPKALEIAWDTGMNAIISGTLNAVNVTTEKAGILPVWPFRKSRQRYEVSLIMNVSDVRCGVLLMTHLESEDKTLSVEEAQERDPDQILRWLLDETLSDMVERQSEEILEALETAQWYGKILSVEGRSIRITGGADAGIEPGMVFDVLGKGETIQCQDGRSVELLGPAMGQIEVTSVMEKEALATPVATGAFLSGMIIQPAS